MLLQCLQEAKSLPTGSKPWQISGNGGTERDSGPNKLHKLSLLSFVAVSLFEAIKSNLFTPSQVTLHITVCLSDLVSRFLTATPLLGGPKTFFFHRVLSPLSAVLAIRGPYPKPDETTHSIGSQFFISILMLTSIIHDAPIPMSDFSNRKLIRMSHRFL